MAVGRSIKNVVGKIHRDGVFTGYFYIKNRLACQAVFCSIKQLQGHFRSPACTERIPIGGQAKIAVRKIRWGIRKKGLSYIEKRPKGKEKILVHKLEREDHIGYISRGQALAVL